MTIDRLRTTLSSALDARSSLFPGPQEHAALRLFHGFLEGFPPLSVELFGRTLVLHDYSKHGGNEVLARAALDLVLKRLPWISSALWKIHTSRDAKERKGRLLLGEHHGLEDRIRESSVWYALDLRLNQDTSFYLDTRGLRGWLLENARGKAVLNTFAYTGSLGVAALVGGASRVVQVDRNRAFLEVAVRSCQLNGFEPSRGSMVVADFFEHVGRLKKQKDLFDVVIVDPPFFSSTSWGRVDLVGEAHRVLNKARPLVGDGGALVAVNNALFLPGAAYYQMLENLSSSGYLRVEELLHVPVDCTGFPMTKLGNPPVDPAPFNHTTKVAVLRVKRKDGRRSSPG